MPRLALSLLGSVQATLDGRPITGFESDRVRALLTYLAVEAGRPHRRATLVGLLWPDWPEPSASTNLRNALSNLRKAIGDREAASPVLLVDRETIVFNPAGDAWVDVLAFQTFTAPQQPAERLSKGIALYRGPFLEGFSLKDSAAFEEWVTATREQLERRCLVTLARLAEQHEAAGDLAKACEVAWRAVDLAPWQEESHRRLMRLMAVSGQRSAALTQYETCRHLLQRELGVEPAVETTRLYEQIRDGVVMSGGEGEWESRSVAGCASGSPPLAPSPIPLLSGLPTFLMPFVGRAGLVAEVRQQLFAPDCRLLSLVGPGGSGKTRLAVEAASGVTAAFPQGVYFVGLAAAQSPDGIVPAIGQAIGFTFREREDPRQQLLSYLRAKTLLLLLDNCEHLFRHRESACSDTTSANATAIPCDIVQAAPGVKLLVTSRASLNVEGEQLLTVGGMGLPEGSRTSLTEASESSAVQLFVQVAQRGQPAFRLTDDNLPHVLAICQRVAGLPLGIVLAAAWLRLLSPAEVMAELEGQGLDFLETDRDDASDRQRSLRAAFDYSWRLLNDRERDVLAGLSVFYGGETYAAAHEVTGATLRDLRSLANSSLLERTPGGRYVLHELLRQYAAEKLDATADGGQAVRDRHAAYYAAALAHWTPELKGLRQGDAFAEMNLEIGNVEVAWRWAIARGHFAYLNEGVEGLWRFYAWWARNREGGAAFRALTDAIAAHGPSQPIGRLKQWAVALALQASFGRMTGKTDEVAEFARRSRVLLDEAAHAGADVRREQAFILSLLAAPMQTIGDIKGAQEVASASLVLYRGQDDCWGMARALASLGTLTHYSGDYETAIHYRRESMEIFRALGAFGDAATLQAYLGMSLFYSGRLQEAESLQVEAVATWRKLGQAGQLSYALYYLAKTLRGREMYAESIEALKESLAIADELGDTNCLALTLKDLGIVRMRLGHYEQARAFLDRSRALFLQIKRITDAAMGTEFLGEVALYENKPAEAHQVLTETLLVLRKQQFHAFIGWATAALAVAALELDHHDEARAKLSEALRAGVSRRDLATVLCTLAGAALLSAAEGDKARAIELYTLVARYPILGDSPQLKIYAGERIPAIVAALPAEEVAAAQARGQAADPFVAAEALLAEWDG